MLAVGVGVGTGVSAVTRAGVGAGAGGGAGTGVVIKDRAPRYDADTRGVTGCGSGDDDSEPSMMAAAANMKSVRLWRLCWRWADDDSGDRDDGTCSELSTLGTVPRGLGLTRTHLVEPRTKTVLPFTERLTSLSPTLVSCQSTSWHHWFE